MAKLLIDTSVLHHAAAIKGEWVDTGVAFWGGVIPVRTGMLSSVERGVSIKETKGGSQTRHIAAIVAGMMDGNHQAHSTDALMLETWIAGGGRLRSPNYGDASLFETVSIVAHTTLNNFQFVLPFDDPIEKFRQYLSECTHEGYREIASALQTVKSGSESSQDAWHIHSTILLGLDFFLTCDTALVGQIRSLPKSDFRKKLLKIVMLPSQFCSDFNLKPMEHYEFSQVSAKTKVFLPRR